MTYNVFSGTLNPTHFTSLHLNETKVNSFAVNLLVATLQTAEKS